MSVFRVITRIIPLTDNESSFEPVPFNVLTDGISKDIKVLNITEPNSGINYRIERIEDVHNVGPGETLESVNKAYAEKLKTIPGFVQLKANDVQSDAYDKSFKFSLPQVVSLKKNSSENVDANSLTISLVKNSNHNKIPKLSKESKKQKKEGNYSESSKSLFKSKNLTYLRKKLKKKSNLKNKIKKRYNNLCNLVEQPCNSSPAPVDVEDGKESNTQQSTAKDSEINTEPDDKKNVSVDDSVYDFEHGELVIIEATEEIDSSKINNEEPFYKSPPTQNSAGDDSNSNTSNQTDSSQTLQGNSIETASNVCNTFLVADDHPLYDLLQPLKKYFVSGECLFCGFIPTDIDYNAAEHMESHISTSDSYSYYKCVCCNEKFFSTRNLYLHALSKEKTYGYMCDICFLKFKRKHYLVRHNLKAHSVASA